MTPYLSIVMAGRNDGYAGNFLERMQCSIGTIFPMLWDSFGLEAEIIIVEWNPPQDAARLSEYFTIKKESKEVCKVITVSNEVHNTLQNSREFPMFEFMAKNVGIRRAEGKFILCTNPDIIFSKGLIRQLAKKNLWEDEFYRCNRFDLKSRIPLAKLHGMDTDVILNVCRSNVGKIHCKEDFKFDYHYNAAGDFTLMSAKNWRELKGYPENPFNTHIDSLMIYLAGKKGLKEIIFPYPIYHQYHDRVPNSHKKSVEWWAFQNEARQINDDNWGLSYLEL